MKQLTLKNLAEGDDVLVKANVVSLCRRKDGVMKSLHIEVGGTRLALGPKTLRDLSGTPLRRE